jgi:FkbM family methyltransferase
MIKAYFSEVHAGRAGLRQCTVGVSVSVSLIVSVAALAAIASAAVLYARRAWLLSTALERQLADSRAHQAVQHRENLDRSQIVSARLETEIGRHRDETGLRLEDVSNSLHRLGESVGGLSELLRETSVEVSGLLSKTRAVSAETAAKIETIADAAEVALRQPLYHFPIDSGRLETMTEAEVIELARSLAVLRPLVPYPKWRFDADWMNPDMAFRLRQRIWQFFNDRKLETPTILRWYHQTRLSLYLGNDISRQVYIAGCIDPNEFVFLDRFLEPGMTFLDAGANEGLYSVFAARRLGAEGTVWAFDPSERELSRLARNLELNNLQVRVFPVALADQTGQAEMMVAGYGHEGLNTLGQFFHEVEGATRELIQVTTLDDIVKENPLARLDVIKIDVEGAELKLLKGASETIRRYRPLLLLEVADRTLRQQGSSREQLLDYLRTLEYELYIFDPYSGLPAHSAAHSDNMIAAPSGMRLPDRVYRPWPSTGNSAGEAS